MQKLIPLTGESIALQKSIHLNIACPRVNMSFDTQMLVPKSKVVADVLEGPKNVAAEVPKKKSIRKQTMLKKYGCQKCSRCFAYATCRNNHQEKCGMQTQPIEEPVTGKKVKTFKRSMDEDLMSPPKLTRCFCTKSKQNLISDGNLHDEVFREKSWTGL